MILNRIGRISKCGLLMADIAPNIGISSALITQIAKLNTVKLTKGIQLLTKEKFTHKENTLEVLPVSNPDSPLVLLYAWMLSKEKHIAKYAKFYNDLGFDVLSVRLTPLDLIRPVKGAQVVTDNVMEFLHKNYKSNPLLVHGFSVGGYAFCEMMAKMSDDMDSYKHIHSRFVGQIWDSTVDIYGIPSGLSKAVTNKVVLQKSIEKYLVWYMKFNYESATKHYMKSSKMMHLNTANVPGLFFFSNNDPVSPPEMSKNASSTWKEVYYKCFEKSAHVGHYQQYRSDYEAEVLTFLERIHLLNERKGRAVIS